MNFVFFQIKILSDQTKRVYEQVINKKGDLFIQIAFFSFIFRFLSSS